MFEVTLMETNVPVSTNRRQKVVLITGASAGIGRATEGQS
jgi:hypothetical protein